jgi:hypothetical protein
VLSASLRIQFSNSAHSLTQHRDLAALSARVLSEKSCPLNSEGAGNAGRPPRPQPRVQMKKAHEHSHHGHTGTTRHSPRNGFNGFLRALPGDQACLTPSSALLTADLTPASGRQNHTTSPYAAAPFVKRTARVHRIPPHVRDDRERPSEGRDGRGYRVDLGQARSGIFLQMGLDRHVAGQPVGQISRRNVCAASRHVTPPHPTPVRSRL